MTANQQDNTETRAQQLRYEVIFHNSARRPTVDGYDKVQVFAESEQTDQITA